MVRLTILLSLLATGCSSAPMTMEAPTLRARFSPDGPVLRILPVADGRERVQRKASVLSLLPLNWERSTFDSHPEEDISLDVTPKIALLQLLQRTASASGTFSAVVTGPRPSSASDHEPSGSLREAELDVLLKRLSVTRRGKWYGLGPLAPLLWILGIPSGETEIEVELELNIREVDGASLWRGTISDRRSRLQGWYYNQDWRVCVVRDLPSIISIGWATQKRDIDASVREETE